ncbi:hypothetical protein DDT52_10075 [Brenneria roseae subsp. roseae]|nr:hypothetical protein DDT52_10075 [Brenneria roseae subsp. roseae]
MPFNIKINKNIKLHNIISSDLKNISYKTAFHITYGFCDMGHSPKLYNRLALLLRIQGNFTRTIKQIRNTAPALTTDPCPLMGLILIK